MNALRKEGYTANLALKDDHIEWTDSGTCVQPQDLEVDNYFRFEGMSDPSDNSILYAISSKKHDMKGLLIHPYGVYAETINAELVRKLQVS